MIASTTAIPTPIAIFFQAFMIPVTVRAIYLPQKAKSCASLQLRKTSPLARLGLTDTHHLVRSCREESSRSGIRRNGRDPLREGIDSYRPGTTRSEERRVGKECR